MKKLNNKGFIDSYIIALAIFAIVGIVILIFLFYSTASDMKEAKEKEDENKIKVEALMENDDYVYFYDGIKINAQAAKDLLINDKCSFYKEKGTMNIYIEKEQK